MELSVIIGNPQLFEHLQTLTKEASFFTVSPTSDQLRDRCLSFSVPLRLEQQQPVGLAKETTPILHTEHTELGRSSDESGRAAAGQRDARRKRDARHRLDARGARRSLAVGAAHPPRGARQRLRRPSDAQVSFLAGLMSRQ